MTIHVPQDLANLIEEAVRTGQYGSEEDVLREALIRLRQAREATAAAGKPTGEPVVPERPLTKRTLLRHLASIGLVDDAPRPSPGGDDANVPSTGEKDEIIDEVVIRERLIEWLVGFL
jgi:Arc/MetJ-type ribon-helix-helix transcriptional regulator